MGEKILFNVTLKKRRKKNFELSDRESGVGPYGILNKHPSILKHKHPSIFKNEHPSILKNKHPSILKNKHPS